MELICRECDGSIPQIKNVNGTMKEVPRDCTQCQAEGMYKAGNLRLESAHKFCDCFKNGHETKKDKELAELPEEFRAEEETKRISFSSSDVNKQTSLLTNNNNNNNNETRKERIDCVTYLQIPEDKDESGR